MNRIDEFADAFQGWMAEWEASRKLASNEQRPIQDSCGHGAQRDAATSGLGLETPAGIQPSGYVDEDGGWIPDWPESEEPLWSDSLTTLERYGRGGK